MQSKYISIMLLITIGIMLTLSYIFKGDFGYVVLGFYAMPVMLVFARRYLKKYRPVKRFD